MMQQQTHVELETQQGGSRDHWRLLETLFDLQEVLKPYHPEPYRGIADGELMYRLRWSRAMFEAVRDQLLEEPDPVLIRTPSGGLALTW